MATRVGFQALHSSGLTTSALCRNDAGAAPPCMTLDGAAWRRAGSAAAAGPCIARSTPSHPATRRARIRTCSGRFRHERVWACGRWNCIGGQSDEEDRQRLPHRTPDRLGRAADLRLSRATASTASSARSTAPAAEPAFVQVRHEEMAAFMACAHAKFTGEVGVCLATSGPGAIHLLNGLYDAKLDHQPVRRDRRPAGAGGARRQLPAGGRPRRRCSRTSRTSTSHMATEPAQVRHLVDRAMRIALAERTVTCLIIPNDVAGGGGRRGAAARARHDPLRRRLRRRRASCRRTSRPAPGRRGAQRRRDGRDAGRRGRAGRRATR